ncbi:axin-like isoform X2 [Anopheles albimanus]|uniref:axin-like isoform X2 n=1 Tax=Anopheles albimanus TaxID=7167 RepID=UPI00164074D4|nr:axin-like isoform X2 [Anopheles albimanus]
MSLQYRHEKIDDFTCSGPRPPVPGEESRRKMTETGRPDRSRDSPPSYVRWAQKLSHLLEDVDGAELFKRYVELEGEVPANRLKFYFACEGLKQQTDPEKITQLIGAIYRRFLKKAKPGTELYVNESMRNYIKAGLKNDLILTADLFDNMQASVMNIIGETTYPHFLQSDIYLQYVQAMQSLSSSSSLIGIGSTSSTGGPVTNAASAPFIPGGSSEDAAAATTLATAGPSTTAEPSTSSVTTSSETTGATDGETHDGQAASGSSGCGPSATAASSSSVAAMMVSSSLTSSSSTSELLSHCSYALPTLHEDSELVNADSIEELYGAVGPGLDSIPLIPPPLSQRSQSPTQQASSNTSKVPMTLTKDALMATQKRRLEMRPPGDGRPHSQRKQHHHHHSSMERRMMRENALTNEEVDTFSIIPRTLRHTQKPLPPMEFAKILMTKLDAVAREQEKDELLCKKLQEAELSDRSQNKVLADAIRQKLQVDDDNDQDILDQHVSRVWSDLTPSRSPGTMSPCPPNLHSRSRRHDMVGFIQSSGATHVTMRHSKSMPDGHTLMGPPMQAPAVTAPSRKLNHKWPSVNTDSGISLFSTDTLTKHSSSGGSSGSRGELSFGSNSRPLSRNMHSDMTATLLQESSRRLEDETRRSKRYQHPLPGSGIQSMPLPPLPAMSMSFSGTSASGGLNFGMPSMMPPPPIPAKPHQAPNEFTIVVYSFCDEEVPYRIKIPGTQPPTLRQFKDYLPKKGNYRFFFKTRCEDLDNPVIQEEVNSDSEPLPLFEGKVMGTVKPAE